MHQHVAQLPLQGGGLPIETPEQAQPHQVAGAGGTAHRKISVVGAAALTALTALTALRTTWQPMNSGLIDSWYLALCLAAGWVYDGDHQAP